MQGQVNSEKLTYYAITYHSTSIEGSTLNLLASTLLLMAMAEHLPKDTGQNRDTGKGKCF